MPDRESSKAAEPLRPGLDEGKDSAKNNIPFFMILCGSDAFIAIKDCRKS
jgi:hypothetical protein